MATNTERTVYIIELRDRFTKGMNRASEASRRFNKATDGVRNKTAGLTKSFGQLGIASKVALGAAAVGMYKLASAAVTVSSKFEVVRKAFDVLLGDKGMGGRLMGWAKEFSRSTIITFDQTVTSIRKLLAYGISEQNIRPLTEMLTTIAAGVGTDRLPYLTLALGQVKSRGRLMGTELRQFREHGVDIISELAKGMGVGTAKVEDMVTKGAVSFDMVVKAMQSMTREGGRFEGMLEEMSKTTTGMWNILKSSWSIAMSNIGDQILPVLNKIIGIITPAVEKLSTIDFQYMGAEMNRFFEVFSRMGNMMFGEKSFFRILYEEFVVFTFNMSGIVDKLVTEINIAANAFKKTGGLVTGFFDLILQNFLKNEEGIKNAQQKLEEAWTGQNKFASRQRDWLAIRQDRRDTDMTRQLRAATIPRDPFETGEYVPGGAITPEAGGTDSGRTKRTNRMVGTGARDVIINIGNLIENVTNNNTHYDKNVEAMQEQLKRALLTVVNDATMMVK